MVAGDFDVSGRRRPIPTEETYEIPCDTVMVAIGEQVDSGFLKDFGVAVNNDATVQVNRFTFRTSVPKVYAAGDLVSGPATAVEAMAHGKEAARAIDAALMGEGRFQTFPLFFIVRFQVKLRHSPAEGFRKNSRRFSGTLSRYGLFKKARRQ